MTNLHEISAEEFNSLNKGAHIYAAPIAETYWRSKLNAMAVTADYWRSMFTALSEKVAVPEHTINTTHKVAVATDTYWQPIDTCPRGVKVQLLGKGNVATYGTYFGDQFWTNWCPLPKKVTT